jgi:hypothetical protein
MRLIVPTALFVALVLAGCGGGGGGQSKADYIKRADAICLDATKKLRALGSPSTPAQVRRFAARAVPIIEGHLRQVRALHPPKDIAADANRVFDNVEQAVRLVGRISTAAAKNDTAQIQTLVSQAAALSAQSGQSARRVGFKQCGRATGL